MWQKASPRKAVETGHRLNLQIGTGNSSKFEPSYKIGGEPERGGASLRQWQREPVFSKPKKVVGKSGGNGLNQEAVGFSSGAKNGGGIFGSTYGTSKMDGEQKLGRAFVEQWQNDPASMNRKKPRLGFKFGPKKHQGVSDWSEPPAGMRKNIFG
ncbi:hypothetical protein FRB94_008925 [Tulasnella sp. JGI-2019a]|nr:hypothetical protein FRB93_008195 [Tulasnella sp. JGI-2019a]KAG8995559.1 hypothetical protein FRB94_008925 [Tulasnella sp. JGI-2019a]